ncbi:MAG TPA: FAD-dependent oxidoreductase [Mycobacteriales bacterium]|nr:FAD-dependent oxidoreductase [Mycobacteriales bacterium]
MADAVVIGAGVIGCAVALELARAGRDVVVVDRAPGPGQGSTSASSAVIRFNYSTWEGVALSWESKHCWEQWRDHLEARADEVLATFHRTGFLMLDVPVIDHKHTAELFDRARIPYEIWDAATLRSRLPQLDNARHWPPKSLRDDAFWADGDGEIGALWCPDGGYVDDPQLAAVNLAAAARRRGVEFRFRHTVAAINRDEERVRGVVLDDGSRLDAPVVVNVGGPWSTKLNALAGVGDDFTIGVRPMRQEVHAADAPTTVSSDLPVVADLDLGTYFRPTPGDSVLVGGAEPACDPLQWLDDADAADPHPTTEVFDAQVTRLARRVPALAVPPSPRGLAGVYDVAADWTPIYDRTALAGYYVAIGTSGNQFKNAPVAGQLMTSLVDAVEAGHDHDADPVVFTGTHTGLTFGLGAFSRRRDVNAESTGTVLG